MIAPTQILSLSATALLSVSSLFGGSGLLGSSDPSGPAPAAQVQEQTVPQSSAPENLTSQTGLSTQLTDMLNAYRVSEGLNPVTQSARLDAESQQWADHLAQTGQFYHDQMYCEGLLCTSENIAITLPDAPLNAFGQWQNSPGHDANLLRENAAQVGHGVAIMQSGDYAGQPVVVQKFFNQY